VPCKEANVNWTKLGLVAEIEFGGWTGELAEIFLIRRES
jgi:hypothetical protein